MYRIKVHCSVSSFQCKVWIRDARMSYRRTYAFGLRIQSINELPMATMDLRIPPNKIILIKHLITFKKSESKTGKKFRFYGSGLLACIIFQSDFRSD